MNRYFKIKALEGLLHGFYDDLSCEDLNDYEREQIVDEYFENMRDFMNEVSL